MAQEADFYTPGEVARMLGLPHFTVLGLLTSGQLEGHQDEQARWWIPATAVDAAVDEAVRHSRDADAPADPSAEETSAMPPVGTTGSADTLAREETTQLEAVTDPVPRTSPVSAHGQSASESGWTTTDTAARALGVSPRTVRRFIDRGDLEGRKVKEGIVEAWEVSIDSLHTLRDRRGHARHGRRNSRRESGEEHSPPDALPDTSPDIADMLRDLTAELVRSSSEAAELRTRLELTERTESSLKEDLKRVREERQRHQEEAQRLREELEAERSKGFWRRLFGG
jgi:predicted transcriptional regulator